MQEFTLFELLMMGMPISGILLAMSVISLTLIVERAWTIRRQLSRGALLIRMAERLSNVQGVERLMGVAQEQDSPAARVLTTVLSAPTSVASHLVAPELNRERTRLERGMQGLATVASVAPYVGLLGTCIGVIKAFQLISTQMGGGPALVAGGISEALVNTALGLFVAIPAVVGYNLLASAVNRHLREISWAAQTALSKCAGGSFKPGDEEVPPPERSARVARPEEPSPRLSALRRTQAHDPTSPRREPPTMEGERSMADDDAWPLAGGGGL